MLPPAEEALKPDGPLNLPTWQSPRAHAKSLTAQQSAMSAAKLWQGLQSPAGSLAPSESTDLRCAQPSLGAAVPAHHVKSSLLTGSMVIALCSGLLRRVQSWEGCAAVDVTMMICPAPSASPPHSSV